MSQYDDDKYACPSCDARFIEDPHPKLSASTVVKTPNSNPPRFQARCRSCGTRGPKKDSRSKAIEEWAKLRRIDQIE